MAVTITAGGADGDNGVLAIPVRLEGVFAEWLVARARAHGEAPEDHAARLLRAYWAHHDTWRHEGGLTVAREVGR